MSGAPKVATLEPKCLHRRDVSGLPTEVVAFASMPSRGAPPAVSAAAVAAVRVVETSHEGTEEKWCFD